MLLANEEQARVLIKSDNWSEDPDSLAKCEGKGLHAWGEVFDLEDSVLDRVFLSNQLIEPMPLHLSGSVVVRVRAVIIARGRAVCASRENVQAYLHSLCRISQRRRLCKRNRTMSGLSDPLMVSTTGQNCPGLLSFCRLAVVLRNIGGPAWTSEMSD